MMGFLLLALFEALAWRALRRHQWLQASNGALSSENNHPFRGLERVQAEVLGMQESGDIVDVVTALWEGLKASEVGFQSLAISVADPDSDVFQYYGSSGMPEDLLPEKLLKASIVPGVQLWRTEAPLSIAVERGWAELTEEGRPHKISTADEEFMNFLKEIWGDIWERSDIREPILGRQMVGVNFAHGNGMLGVVAGQKEKYSKSEVQVLQAFAEVISLGYTRYFDLHQLETGIQALEDSNRELEATVQQLRETRGQLVMKEKMASLGKVVAGVAPEINNPIEAVNSSVDTADRCVDRIVELLKKPETQDAVLQEGQLEQVLKVLKDNTRNALSAGKRIAQVIKSLESFARLDEAEFLKVDLHEGIDSTLRLQQHELKDEIEVVTIYSEIPKIYCYAGELNQVFMNLLINAIQAIEGQGMIRIETSADPESVYVKFSDTGRGILPEHLGKIFDPAVTLWGSGVGTGLGLATSYNIVQKHKGEIEVDSEFGKGSMFTVRIPLVTAEVD